MVDDQIVAGLESRFEPKSELLERESNGIGRINRAWRGDSKSLLDQSRGMSNMPSSPVLSITFRSVLRDSVSQNNAIVTPWKPDPSFGAHPAERDASCRALTAWRMIRVRDGTTSLWRRLKFRASPCPRSMHKPVPVFIPQWIFSLNLSASSDRNIGPIIVSETWRSLTGSNLGFRLSGA